MMSLFAVLIDGTIYASWLFLVAAGLTVIYGVMRILNMAHGSFYAIWRLHRSFAGGLVFQ